MGSTLSDVIIGVLVACLGLIGLFAAAGALDIEMSIFGWSMAGFALVFILGLIKRHYDEIDAARHAPQAVTIEGVAIHE
ncbi:MAG: hypothetical protein KGK10_13890 [Rhodospirillales bacterium]|nr:hypothetical protein [Rhodospirillales bacterium]